METPALPALIRPTQIVAEALVAGYDEHQITDQAKRLGFSPPVTTAIIAACCGTRRRHAPTNVVPAPGDD